MGSVGKGSSITTRTNDGMVTLSAFMAEANRQGINGTNFQSGLDDYVTSSFGGISLGNKISNFIENAPKSILYNGGTLYRGLWFNSTFELSIFLHQHPVGSTLNTRADGISWSADSGVAQAFSTDVTSNSVILVNDDKNRIAMGIKNISDTPISSQEVLWSNKVDFTVSKIENKNDIIYMHVKQKRSKK